MSGRNCPGHSHAWEHWEQRVRTIHLINDCKYLCLSHKHFLASRRAKPVEGGRSKIKSAWLEGEGAGGHSPLSSPAPPSSWGPQGLPLHKEAGAGEECSLPQQLPATARHGEAWAFLSLDVGLPRYLNSTGCRGEGQQPPRRALRSDGFWGQTGWRPPYVIDAEKELKVTMAPINTLASSL